MIFFKKQVLFSIFFGIIVHIWEKGSLEGGAKRRFGRWTGMKLNEGLIFTNDNCIGCNRCISGCPVLGANVSVKRESGENHIYVDNDKCLHCGRCLASCRHNAREFRDDTDRFLADLGAGEPISLLVAPSFFIIYEEVAMQILGYLRDLGVRLIYDVSYGADIATWAYLKWIEENGQAHGAIAPPCSAVVNYIEKYSELLSERLIPVKSPLMCLATYLRKYQGVTDRLAFLSPCIAKKDEIDAPGNEGLVSYNVTFDHLSKALEGVDFEGHSADVEMSDFGLGRLYPVPGGLSDNIRHFVPVGTTIREVHGERSVYDYFMRLEERIQEGRELPFIVDCLNCSQGCLSGTATAQHCRLDDDIYFRLQKYRCPNPKISPEENPYLDDLPLEERRRRLSERFSGFSLSDFMHTYEGKKYLDERHTRGEDRVDDEQLEAVFLSMHKKTDASRKIDCHSCGYNSCTEMATAILRGYNSIENCVHYVKDEILRVSMIDLRNDIANYSAYVNFMGSLIAEGRLSEYTVIAFNINNFKFVNEKYGYRAGDRVLKEYCAMAERLAGDGELIALTGGNDFVGIIKKGRVGAVIDALGEVSLLSLDKELGKEDVPLSARVAVYEPDGTDASPEKVLEKLSITLDAIDRAKGQRVLCYDDGLLEKQARESMLAYAVEPALRAGEFRAYYQPKVDMASRKIVGAEALIRWVRDGRVIPPADFVPVCERMGLVQKLDFFVLESVCRDIAEWTAKGIEMVKVSVNFSKYHFVSDSVADRINEVAERYGIDKHLLEIEFTETAYMVDSKKLISNIDKLHSYGIASSMDDFGTGYSSLNMLQNMSFDTLKLDKSFLDNGDFEDARSRAVIENIIRMARELGMTIVSEGIETERELEYMRDMHCDMAQGYLFDKPLQREEFEKRLIRRFYP